MSLKKGDIVTSKSNGSFEIVDVSPPDAKGDVVAYLRHVKSSSPDTLRKRVKKA